jgi:NADH-quinone oxidoreductase subunit C
MTDRLKELLHRSGCKYSTVRSSENYLHVRVPAERVTELLLAAKDSCGMSILQLISAVDFIEDFLFQLTWILESATDGRVFMVSATYPRESCRVPSLGGIWPAAVIFERELREMYGMEFPGNPRQDEDFLLEGWDDIPPMRRDFDSLEYSMRKFGERRSRIHEDPRSYVSKKTGEWNTPVPIDKEEE